MDRASQAAANPQTGPALPHGPMKARARRGRKPKAPGAGAPDPTYRELALARLGALVQRPPERIEVVFDAALRSVRFGSEPVTPQMLDRARTLAYERLRTEAHGPARALSR